MIYLDNAATSYPKPAIVTSRVSEAFKKYGANPGRSGHDMSVKTTRQIYECRKKAAELFGAVSPDKVVFTGNCTMALNLVIKGILKQGDRVVISNLEHNAVVRPVFSLAEKGIISCDVAEVYPGDFDKTAESFKKVVLPGTKAVICMHASNVFGAVLPIKEIGRTARENGSLFIVDAAQSAGVLPINIEEMNIDYLCLPGHKGLYGPMGTGMIVFGKNAPLPDTVIEGGTGSNSVNFAQPDFLPDRFESGTVNVPGIIGVGAGIDFLNKKGQDRIYSHEMKLISYLYGELSKRNYIKLYTEKPEYMKCAPVLSFNIGSLNSETAAEMLNRYGICTRAGLHCAPLAHKRLGTDKSGTVRVCPSVFTEQEDVTFLLNCLEKIAKFNKI